MVSHMGRTRLISVGNWALAWSECCPDGVWRQAYGLWHELRGGKPVFMVVTRREE